MPQKKCPQFIEDSSTYASPPLNGIDVTHDDSFKEDVGGDGKSACNIYDSGIKAVSPALVKNHCRGDFEKCVHFIFKRGGK